MVPCLGLLFFRFSSDPAVGLVVCGVMAIIVMTTIEPGAKSLLLRHAVVSVIMIVFLFIDHQHSALVEEAQVGWFGWNVEFEFPRPQTPPLSFFFFWRWRPWSVVDYASVGKDIGNNMCRDIEQHPDADRPLVRGERFQTITRALCECKSSTQKGFWISLVSVCPGGWLHWLQQTKCKWYLVRIRIMASCCWLVVRCRSVVCMSSSFLIKHSLLPQPHSFAFIL